MVIPGSKPTRGALTADDVLALHESGRAELARRDLLEFTRQSWATVEPAVPFVDNWHIGAIARHLEAVTSGQILDLLINIPPGHAKSLMVSVIWPAWIWTHTPWWRSIFSAWHDDLTTRDSTRCRMLLDSDWYKAAFRQGEDAWDWAPDQNLKTYYRNTLTGERLSLPVGGGTGFRGHLVVCDDPLKVTHARNKLKRDAANEWWFKAMSSRFLVMEQARRVVVMQRLHDEDLSGEVLKMGGYEHLCLPTWFDKKRRSKTFITYHGVRTPFWQDPRKAQGEKLFPKLFSDAVLDKLKKQLGSFGTAGQLQQRPEPDTGGLFKKTWWRFWRHPSQAPNPGSRPDGCDRQTPAHVLAKVDREVIVADLTFKETDSGSFVVFAHWGIVGADKFLLGLFRQRIDYETTRKEFVKFCKDRPGVYKKLIEAKANGPALISDLKRLIPGLVAWPDENHKDMATASKEEKAAVGSPQIEAGNVYIHEGAPWVDEYVAEHAAFPNGSNDDQVDVTAMFLIESTEDGSWLEKMVGSG